MTIVVAFDGGARPNPGRGYGSFSWQMGDGKCSQPEILDFGDCVTSNQAEYRTLIAALKKMREQFPDKNIEVRSDSQLLVRQMTGEYRVRNEKLKPLWEHASELATQFASVKWEWHPREESLKLFGH